MKSNQIKVQSPGRINIIGEHTDYNGGLVLPAAIDKKTIFILEKNGTTHQVNLYAENYKESYTYQLNQYTPLPKGWQNYIMGVTAELQKLTKKIKGFNTQFKGNIPIGSGLSSSASIECGIAFGLNELFNLGLDKWALIKVSQQAEHHFVGNNCGIMDQFASVMGKKNQVMLLDCNDLSFYYFPLKLESYEFLLLNTNISHNLADTEYNLRKKECELGLTSIQKKHPEIKSFRDLTIELLEKLKDQINPKHYQRCLHFTTENQRVLNATEALLSKNFKQLGSLLYQSHQSLTQVYEVSCPELDFLVKQTLPKDFILGARMMGGGFGGCTLNLIEKNKSEHFIKEVSKSYFKKFGFHLTPYLIETEQGSSIID